MTSSPKKSRGLPRKRPRSRRPGWSRLPLQRLCGKLWPGWPGPVSRSDAILWATENSSNTHVVVAASPSLPGILLEGLSVPQTLTISRLRMSYLPYLIERTCLCFPQRDAGFPCKERLTMGIILLNANSGTDLLVL